MASGPHGNSERGTTTGTAAHGDEPVLSGDVTAWLHRLRDERTDAHHALGPLVYDELHRMAERAMRGERSPITLQPTALVHEAWMRLLQQHSTEFENRSHFFAIAARVMRRVLVDMARRRTATKRDGGAAVPIDGLELPDRAVSDAEEVLHVHEALEALAAIDERQARVVEMRFFTGFTNEEIAVILGVSDRTVKRDWTLARAWLHRHLTVDS